MAQDDDVSDVVELGGDDAQEALPSLESKYHEQMRQIVTQKLELPITSLPSMLDPKTGQIDLSPEFQRRNIWDNDRRSRFIESVIMNIPIPPVFLGEVDYATYAVLDGRQRLTALHEFMRNNYRLSNLNVWSELQGKNFNDMKDDGLDKYFIRRFIPAIVVLRESSTQVKYDVFDRLNTGGIVAEPMEIRNAVFPGEFNDLLHSLTKTEEFLYLWNIPSSGPERVANKIYARMQDLELALRFFGVSAYTGGMKFKDFLGDFMDQKNKEYARDNTASEKDRIRFMNAHRNAKRIFDSEAFRKPIPGGGRNTNKSAPFADAILAALTDLDTSKITPTVIMQIKDKFDQLILEDESFRNSITAGTNGKGSIETRISIAKKAVSEIIG